MFDTLTVPAARNSSYFGIMTQKAYAVEYLRDNNHTKTGVKLGFRENTPELVVLKGDMDVSEFTGSWWITLKDLTDNTTYRAVVMFHKGVMLEVADHKGIIWIKDGAVLPKQLHRQCLETAGCWDIVEAGLRSRNV